MERIENGSESISGRELEGPNKKQQSSQAGTRVPCGRKGKKNNVVCRDAFACFGSKAGTGGWQGSHRIAIV